MLSKPGLPLRLLRLSIVIKFLAGFLLILPVSVLAQSLPIKRVLVLHGVWTYDRWETAFDNALEAEFAGNGEFAIELSSRYLGLDTGLSENALATLAAELQFAIDEQSVDLIIAALPSANTFLGERINLADIPLIRVLPDPDEDVALANRPDTVTIQSAGQELIATSLNQMLQLRPDASEFVVLAGTSATDQVYLEIARSVVAAQQWPVAITFVEGASPDSIYQLVSELPEGDAVLMLPFESFGANRSPVPLNFSAPIAAASSVPVFTIYDATLGGGVVGGHMSTAANIAGQVIDYSYALLSGNGTPAQTLRTTGVPIYDWRAVTRWGLDMDRLTLTPTLLFRPLTLWEERPILVIIWANVFLLLLLFIAIQSFLFMRYRRTQQVIGTANAAALENERKYRFLAENSLDVIWVWNEDKKVFEYCSPSINKLTGFSAQEFISSPLSSLFSKESVSKFLECLEDRDRDALVIELQQLTKQGEPFWCEVAARRSINGDAGASEWVGVSRDISERKNFEKEKSRLESHVRQAQKFDSLGTLAGGIAHDINNILGVIYGASDLLETTISTNASAKEYLQEIRQASEGAKNLVNQVLTFSRQSPAAKELISLNDVVQSSMELLKSGLPESVSMEWRIDSERMQVVGDATQIEQLLLNLVTNAYESMEAGSGSITVELKTVELAEPGIYQFGSLSTGSYAVISVRDTGKGIAQDQLDRIFEPFYSSKELGNGLGLAIVYGVVRDHNGAVNVSSIVGSGTVFTIYLPLSQESRPELEAPLPEEFPPMASMEIMLIDDRKDMLRILSVMLTQLGHSCKLYSNPEEALHDLFDMETPPDLVITDYSMPGVSGLDIAGFCQTKFPELPVFLVTGYGDQVLEQASGENSSVKMVLQKPFNLTELQRALATLKVE